MSNIKITSNGLRAGDRVQYEVDEDDSTGRMFFIKARITSVLDKERCVIRNEQNQYEVLMVKAEDCDKLPDCDICEDRGFTLIRAHQAYTHERGTYIEDDKEVPCTCTFNEHIETPEE